MSGGTALLNDGALQLSTGIDTLKSNTPILTAGAQQLNAGATALKSGIQTYTDGVSSANSGAVILVSGTVVKYICSLGQEICFGPVAWDYSHLPLNINGRVCLLYSLFWGVRGLFWVKLVIPFMSKCFDKINIPFDKVIIWAFIAFFVFDATLSASTAIRMDKRDNGEDAKNHFEQYLDTHYDDETMQKIYANSKSVEKTK